MKNTLLIHIGKMKTGTTALQVFLYENREKLRQYGWCYPDLKKELPELQTWFLANKEKNGTVFYTTEGNVDVTSENWNRTWETVLRSLEKYNVVISSEEIDNQDTEKFLAGAKEKYDNIKVVVYLRRQDKAVESLWNQEIKGGWTCAATIQEFISEDVVENFYYLKKLDRISEIIGKENVIVKAYEKQQFCGTNNTITSDFLSILGINPDEDEWKDCYFPNPRLEGNYLEIKKVFNSIQLAQSASTKEGQYAQSFMALSQFFYPEKKNEGYFTLDERKKFLEQFYADNSKIAQEYLHREDGKLFYDNNMDYPLYDVVPRNAFTDDMIRAFSTLICMQNDSMQKMFQFFRRQNYFFARKFLLQNMQGRKLIFFGAGYWCCELMRNENFPISLIIDNDKEKSGKVLYGVKVVYAEEIIDWSKYFVVVTCANTCEIERQLQRKGLYKEKDYVLAKEYLMYDE